MDELRSLFEEAGWTFTPISDTKAEYGVESPDGARFVITIDEAL